MLDTPVQANGGVQAPIPLRCKRNARALPLRTTASNLAAARTELRVSQHGRKENT